MITALYGYQISTAFPGSSSPVAQPGPATLVFIFFGAGTARAGNCPACAAEACLTCSHPAVAGGASAGSPGAEPGAGA